MSRRPPACAACAGSRKPASSSDAWRCCRTSAWAHGLTAVVEVTLDRQGAEHLDAFEQRAVADAGVQQCYRVSPGPDFVLVAWAADMPAYHALVQRLFTQDANVRNVKAFFSVQARQVRAGHRAAGVPSQARASSASPLR